MFVLLLLALIALGFAFRWLPLALAQHGAGIDHWYWKAYVETYRREGQFPPSLPQYVLEDDQWYPPLFGWLLTRLPGDVFDRFAALIAIGIDLARMLLLLVYAWHVTDRSIAVVVVAGLLYATTPIQVSYNIQLNPRGLAALILDGVLLLVLTQLDPSGPWWAWLVIVFLSGLILLTHKMTTQLYWFLVVGTAVLYGRWPLLLLLPASVAAALLLSRGSYVKVVRAHMDIVAFWNRNWPWVGSDLLRESPVYGDGSYERPEKLHRTGILGRIRQAATMVYFSPAAWIACLLVYERLWLKSPVLIFPSYLLVWLLLVCLFAILTTWMKPLKCLGAGYLYLYNGSLLSALLLGITYKQTLVPQVSQPFIIGAILCNLAALAVYVRHFQTNPRQRVHEELDSLIDELRTLPRGVVMCIPPNWYEVVAYKSGHPVLWGGHGFGFRKLEPTFPRLLLPLGSLIERYDIRYLLTMDGMLTPQFAAEVPTGRVVSRGAYRLHCFERAAEPVPHGDDVGEPVHAD